MDTFRIVVALWGLFCLGFVVYGALNFPVLKLKTPMAMDEIERRYINLTSLSDDDKKFYDFNKSWVVGNYHGLMKSAKVRQIYLSIVGLITSMFCFFCAAFLL